MLKFLNRGVSTPIVIGIIVVLVIIAGGGILAYQYYYIQEKEQTKPPVIEKSMAEAPNQIKPVTEKICSFLSRYSNEQYQDGLTFRVQGKNCAVVIKENNGYTIEVNGLRTKTYPDILFSFYQANFSPDGKHFAFTATQIPEGTLVKYGQRFVVADGNDGPIYDNIYYPQYSQDSKHLGYCAVKGKNYWSSNPSDREKDVKYFSVIDGIEKEIAKGDYNNCDLFSTKKEVDEINKFSAVSPDGKYRIERDLSLCPNLRAECGNVRMSLTFIPTGEVTKYGKYNDAFGAVFSPDSKHFAYIARLSSKDVVVVDGENYKNFDEVINNLSFSNDSKSIIYNARLGSDIYYIVKPLK